MLAVSQVGVGAQSAQERLLERVLRGRSPEQAGQVAEDGVPMIFVEALEGRNCHSNHHSP